MSMFTGKSVDNFRQRADVLNREDIFCLSNKKIGCKDGNTDIYLMHYAYSDVIPTKVQIQDAVNKDFGQLVVIDPTEVMVGPRTYTVKAYTQYALPEQTSPKKYVNNLKASVEERPEAVLVEVGDVVRYFDSTVVEGQIVSADQDGFAVRVGSTIERVAADSIIDVKQSPMFYPTDKAAYDYFLKLYPKDYAKELTNNVKEHEKNLSWTEKLSDSENKGEKELEKIHKLPTVQTWDLKKGEDGRPAHKDLPSWNLKKGKDGRPAHDGKGYTPAGDSWKEKEIANMKKKYSEGTESWFRQKKFKGGVNKFEFEAGMLDSITEFLSSKFGTTIEKFKGKLDRLHLTEEQKEIYKKLGLKHLSDKYGISEEELFNLNSPKTAGLKDIAVKGLEKMNKHVIPVMLTLIGCYLVYTAYQGGQEAMDVLLKKVYVKDADGISWVENSDLLFGDGKGGTKEKWLNYFVDEFWTELQISMGWLIAGFVSLIKGIRSYGKGVKKITEE